MALHTVAHSSNPVLEHEFEWTIENITRIPCVLRGPSFSPIPRRSETFCFSIERRDISCHKVSFDICLDIASKDNTFNVIGHVVLYNANNTNLGKFKIETWTVEPDFKPTLGRFDMEIKHDESWSVCFPEDKLIMKAKLSISGYDKYPNTCSPKNSPTDGLRELSKDLKTMFENGFGHDVTFSLDGKTIPAHTAILCTRSPVFAKMFQQDMLETNSKKVDIEDVDFAIFNSFLLFLYTGEVEEQNWKAAISLYSAADKYEVDSLRKECSRMLDAKMTIDSFTAVLMLADLHSDAELKEIAKIYFRRNFARVIETSDWLQLVNDNPLLASELLRSIKSNN